LYNAGYQINADISFVNIQDLPTLATEVPPRYIHLRTRLQSVRSLGGLCLLTLRQNLHTVRGVLPLTPEQELSSTSFPIDRDDLKWASSIASESVIDVYGFAAISPAGQESELRVRRILIVSAALERDYLPTAPPRPKDELLVQSQLTPFLEEQKRLEQQIFQSQTPPELRYTLKRILQENMDFIWRLKTEHGPRSEFPAQSHNRSFHLRSKFKQAIHRIRSKLLQSVHNFFHDRDFIEMHTPKLLECAEPSWEQFSLQHRGKALALEKTAQKAHQTAMMANFGKVYEVGTGFWQSGWRLSERTMLDFTSESFGSSWMDYLKIVSSLLVHVLQEFASKCKEELEIIQQYTAFSPVTLSHPLSDAFSRGEAIPIVTWKHVADRYGMFYEEEFQEMVSQESQVGQIILSTEGSSIFIVSNDSTQGWQENTIEADPEHPGYICQFKVWLNGKCIMVGQRVPAVAPDCPQYDRSSLTVEDFVTHLLRLQNTGDGCLFPKTDKYWT
jgi:aspartyl/asparaginyl-tRNA synthetase